MPGEDNDEGKARISFKIDGAFITSLIALISALGFGSYTSATSASQTDVDTAAEATVTMADNHSAVAEHLSDMVILLQRRDEEIDTLYAQNEWMVGVLMEFGRRHPSQWRKLKRDAPTSIDFSEGGSDAAVVKSAARRPASIAGESSEEPHPLDEVADEPSEPEELYQHIQQTKKATQMPVFDTLRSSVKSKKGQP